MRLERHAGRLVRLRPLFSVEIQRAGAGEDRPALYLRSRLVRGVPERPPPRRRGARSGADRLLEERDLPRLRPGRHAGAGRERPRRPCRRRLACFAGRALSGRTRRRSRREDPAVRIPLRSLRDHPEQHLRRRGVRRAARAGFRLDAARRSGASARAGQLPRRSSRREDARRDGRTDPRAYGTAGTELAGAAGRPLRCGFRAEFRRLLPSEGQGSGGNPDHAPFRRILQ